MKASTKEKIKIIVFLVIPGILILIFFISKSLREWEYTKLLKLKEKAGRQEIIIKAYYLPNTKRMLKYE